MQLSPLPSQAYSIDRSSDGLEFHFVTDHGIQYIFKIDEADGYVPSASFAKNAKTFGFGPISATRPKGKLPKDDKVAVAIFEICYSYLKRNPDAVLIYICSNESVWNPGKENKNSRYGKQRSETFSQWFNEWQKSGAMPAEKIDFIISGTDYCSCVFRSGNPFEQEIRDVITNTILAKDADVDDE